MVLEGGYHGVIYVDYEFVRCLRKKIEVSVTPFDRRHYLDFSVLSQGIEYSGSHRISADELSIKFVSSIVHELSHLIVSWWTNGRIRTPRRYPNSREAGAYVVNKFFGGVLKGFWFEGDFGNVTKLSGIEIQNERGEYMIGECWEPIMDNCTGIEMLYSRQMRGKSPTSSI
jgi:hypothetical protein